MKKILFCAGLLLVALTGYAWIKNQPGCMKLVHDTADLIASVAPIKFKFVNDANGGSSPQGGWPPDLKPWSPPSPFPTELDWTWKTSSGALYQDVVIDKVEPDIVSITHSAGHTDIPIADLPNDLQAQLNYDPAVAQAVVGERQREDQHPYYKLSALADAQAIARKLGWPLVWLAGNVTDLSSRDSDNDEIWMTQFEVKYLSHKHVIIIFLDGDAEVDQTPLAVHRQFAFYDDGPLPNNANYDQPKLVFTDVDGETTYGRVAASQVKKSGQPALDAVLSQLPPTAFPPP